MAAPPDPRREKEIFAEALELTAPSERAAYLRGACGEDAALRQRIEALLAVHQGQSKFLPEGGGADGSSTLIGDSAPKEQPGVMIGRYKLLEKLGEGGFGSVWAAEQREPVKRRVALKIIKLGMDTRQVVARFEAERQALALMDHPNIARVLDAGATDSGRPYFVMELVKGIPFTKYCDQEKLGTKDRLDLFIKVCHAIQHAHQKGVIHRDIKPSNILVTLHDGVPVPKVIDFGIAKATQQELTELTIYTQHHQFIGTPAYMSPEQAEMSGLDIDTRSDIYSLGVLLYELLTGSTPFDTKELMQSGIDEMRRIIREKEPMRPSTKLSQTLAAAGAGGPSKSKTPAALTTVDRDLDWIVMKCLEKDRARRYETANGLAADLKRHLGHEPVLARPPSAAYKFQKAWKRNRLVVTAATAVAAALVIGLGVSIWQAVRATHAEREQKKLREVVSTALEGERQQRTQAQSERVRADEQARKASDNEQQSRRFLYASDMNLAQQALKLNNVGKARRLLDRHRPQPGEEDLRGWEWRYLWQQTRSRALVTLTKRPVRGFDVSFSPDGTHLAVGWFDGRVDLWNVPGRQFIRALMDHVQPHQGHVAFSPVRNLLAATSGTNTVTLYDLDSGQESMLWRPTDPIPWRVRSLSFSQDGSRLVIYAGSSRRAGDAVWVVNVSSGAIEFRNQTPYSDTYLHGAARLSPDNRRLYLSRSDTASYRYSISCLELATGKELWSSEPQRDYGLTALAMSPDGNLLASGSGFEDPAIRIWEAATGRLMVRLDGHTGWVGKLVFSEDGRQLISAAADQTIRVWDAGTWTEARVLRGHSDEVHAVAISERAKLIASAGKDGSLMLWQEQVESSADGYLSPAETAAYDFIQPLGQSYLFAMKLGQPLQLVDLKHRGPPKTLPELEPPARFLGFFGTNSLCYWNGTNQIIAAQLQRGSLVQPRGIALNPGARPAAFAFHPGRQLMAWVEAETPGSVYVAGLATPARRTELKSDVGSPLVLQFNQDGDRLELEGPDKLRVWLIETGQIIASIDEPVTQAAFAAGGRVLAVNMGRREADHEIRFYDLSRPGSIPRSFPGKESSVSLAVSPDGGMVASSTYGGLVRLFDPTEGELIESIRGHLNAVLGVAFSPDGRRLISASGAREAIKVWDARTHQELPTLSGSGSFLQRALWSPDGDAIAAGRPWQVWHAPSWEEISAAEATETAEMKQP